MHAELTVQDLWLRYVALGGSEDAFEIDGYLQGLVGLDTFQQDVLSQAVNEGLDDAYRSSRVPLSDLPPGTEVATSLRRVAEELLEPGAKPDEDGRAR